MHFTRAEAGRGGEGKEEWPVAGWEIRCLLRNIHNFFDYGIGIFGNCRHVVYVVRNLPQKPEPVEI